MKPYLKGLEGRVEQPSYLVTKVLLAPGGRGRNVLAPKGKVVFTEAKRHSGEFLPLVGYFSFDSKTNPLLPGKIRAVEFLNTFYTFPGSRGSPRP